MTQRGQRIEAVTFDLWETLLFEKDGNSDRRAYARCGNVAQVLKGFGLAVSVADVEASMKQTIDYLVKVWDGDRDVTHLDQLKLIVEYSSKGSVSLRDEWVDELSAAYVSPLVEVPPYLNPDALEVLQSLKSEGRRVGLICNTGVTPGFMLRRFLEQLGAARYFDVMVFSDEEGVRKPDRRIFQMTADRLGIEPRGIAHVGDNLRMDVWGAKNAGYKAILFASVEGHDRVAEKDPTSLVALSRKLGDLKEKDVVPDRSVTRLRQVSAVIEELGM